MKTLITPAEVVELAFTSDSCVRASQIPLVEIVAAQEEQLRPVFGALLDAMLEGQYEDVLGVWIKPALAEFVRSRVVLSLGMVSSSGVAAHSHSGTRPATSDELLRVSREAAARARTLRARALAIVEASPELFPEYTSENNILNRIHIVGGIIV